MSYEIIKSIKVVDGKVFINGASNNVHPHYFSEFHCESLTKILQEQGQDALDVEILKEYESGMFQQGNNKYTRALRVLRHMPEYKLFDWRVSFGPEYNKNNERRKTEEFKKLLLKALKTRLPSDKYIAFYESCGRSAYLSKLTKTRAFFSYEADAAKTFPFAEEIENLKRRFNNGDSWIIKQIA